MGFYLARRYSASGFSHGLEDIWNATVMVNGRFSAGALA